MTSAFLSPLAYWVHNIDPFMVRFPENFPIDGIRWYGVAYFLGFIIATYLLTLYHKKNISPLNFDDITTWITALIVGVIIGGRLGYMLFYDFQGFISNPLKFFYFTQGGMASHGGIIGIILATYWFSKNNNKISFLRLCDYTGTFVGPGIFLGRIANFINGALWGKVTTVPWAVKFPLSAPFWGAPDFMIEPRHPSQLYAATLEGLLFFAYGQFRLWKTRMQLPQGQLFGEMLIAYAILRIIHEYFREPDAALILGLSRGVFYSLFVAIIGLAIFCYSKSKKQSCPPESG